MDLLRLRRALCRRHRCPDLPDELAGRVRVRAQSLRGKAAVPRGRRAAREDREGPRSARAPRDDRDHGSRHRRPRRGDHARRTQGPGRGHRGQRLHGPRQRDPARRPLHDRLHLGHHWSAEGLPDHARQLPQHHDDGRVDDHRRPARDDLPVPAAGARVRAPRAVRRHRHRSDDRLLAAQSADDHRRRDGAQAAFAAERPAYFREALHARQQRRALQEPGGAGAVPEGDRGRLRGSRTCRRTARKFPPTSRRSSMLRRSRSIRSSRTSSEAA